jgi:hypothetical protein
MKGVFKSNYGKYGKMKKARLSKAKIRTYGPKHKAQGSGLTPIGIGPGLTGTENVAKGNAEHVMSRIMGQKPRVKME